jgi:lysophospholipase L1-like esterase
VAGGGVGHRLSFWSGSCEATCRLTRTSIATAGITLLLSGAVLTLVATSQARTTAQPVFAPPQQYYLALGDSIAYGAQPAKMSAGLPPSGFHTGYVDVFAARLRGLAPKIRVVNYGCPGESTQTFISGGCPWLAEGRRLHDPFKGTQLGAALAFLRTHRGQVSPITLTLWGNDLDKLAEACKGSFACIQGRAPRALAQIASRLTVILRRLRAAAPKAEIILTGAWNFNVDDLRQTDPLFHSVDATIARMAAGARARFADIFPVFNPQGNLAREKARICALTFTCSEDDPHPTDAGYRAIAAALWVASGYTHRS